jgi:hypothetical protein
VKTHDLASVLDGVSRDLKGASCAVFGPAGREIAAAGDRGPIDALGPKPDMSSAAGIRIVGGLQPGAGVVLEQERTNTFLGVVGSDCTFVIVVPKETSAGLCRMIIRGATARLDALLRGAPRPPPDEPDDLSEGPSVVHRR